LTSLEGLNALNPCGGELGLYENPVLTSLTALDSFAFCLEILISSITEL